MRQSIFTLLLFAIAFSSHSQVRTFDFNPKQIINTENVEIIRDEYGVPHIFGKTDAEVAYGLEWATCEDDFETLQYLLMAAKCYLGIHLGVEGARIDYAVQAMGLHEFVEQNYESGVADDFKLILEAACQGVNAYAAAHPEEVWVKKSFPVTPQEVIIGFMLGQSLMAGVDGVISGILDGRFAKELPKKEINDDGVGSNAYAFNSALSDHGNTYHVINSHQPIDGILSWYEAHLHSEEGWNITGALFHGSVSVLHGTNENLSWAHTTGDLDLQDVYVMNMHPKKKKWYKFDGEWHKLQTKRAKLRVGLGKKQGFKITIGKKYWWSKYGPTFITEHGTFAFRMPSLFEMNAGEQWYRMNKSKNFTEFYKALDIQGIVMQNITYADKNDTIFFIANGKVPVRNPNYDWSKVLPGDTSATLWTEYLKTEELAQNLNPACGYVFNANNCIYNNTCLDYVNDPDLFPVSIGYDAQKQTNRGNRSKEILEGLSHIDYEGVKKLKFDIQFPDSMVFLKNYPIMELFSMNPDDHPDIADVITKFNNWNFRGDSTDMNAAVVFTMMYEMYHDNTFSVKDIRENDSIRQEFFLTNLRDTKARLMEHFGSIDIPLGKVQVLSRGGVDLAINGGPDAIRAVYCNPRDDGKLPMYIGDGLVQLVKFTKDGPEIESISPYGASNKPGSKHYTTQMKKFVANEFKKMSLDKTEVYKNASEIYHPGTERKQ
ncbi:penicillin acylase family protein [Flavobacteriales bacterium]|nr:penicillin acylase family protein [Flavobacteriales bacterium]